MKVILFLSLITVLSCVYPRELRKTLIPPLYDEWGEGYSDTSPEMIMVQIYGLNSVTTQTLYDEMPPMKEGYSLGITEMRGDTIKWTYVLDDYELTMSTNPSARQWSVYDTTEPPMFKINYYPMDTSYSWLTNYYNDDPIIRMSDLIEYERACYYDTTELIYGPTFTGFIQYIKTKQ